MLRLSCFGNPSSLTPPQPPPWTMEMDHPSSTSLSVQFVEFPAVCFYLVSIPICFFVASSFGFKRTFHSWRPCSGGAERTSRRGGSAYGSRPPCHWRRDPQTHRFSPAAHTDFHRGTEQSAGALPAHLILAFPLPPAHCADARHPHRLRAKLLIAAVSLCRPSPAKWIRELVRCSARAIKEEFVPGLV
jgi:hypothetical protein